MLYALATFASPNGRNIRPTYEFLQGIGYERPSVARVLKQLYDLGLVVRTHQGRGEGNASVWRICLESEHFPETYPTRKDAELTSPADNLTSPAGEANVTPQPSLGNPEQQLMSPPEVTPSITPSSNTSNHPPNQISAKTTADLPQPAKLPEGWMEGAPQPLASMGLLSAKEKKQIEALAAPYLLPWKLMREFIEKWMDTRPRGMTGLGQPWLAFFKENSASKLKAFVHDSHSRSLKHLPGFAALDAAHMEKVRSQLVADRTLPQTPEEVEYYRRKALTDEEREREDRAEKEELFGPQPATPAGNNEEPV